ASPRWHGCARHGSSTRGEWCASWSRRASRDGPTSRSTPRRRSCRVQSAPVRSITVVTEPIVDENARAERLLDAQAKAAQLFDEIERRGLIRPGVGEKELSDEIRELAADLLGVKAHWHRRIVRAGENTLQPFQEYPPD